MEITAFKCLAENKRLPKLIDFINEHAEGNVPTARLKEARDQLSRVSDGAHELFSNQFPVPVPSTSFRVPAMFMQLYYAHGARSFISQAKKLPSLDTDHPAKAFGIQLATELALLNDALNEMKSRAITAVEARKLRKEEVRQREVAAPVTTLSKIIAEAVEKMRPKIEGNYQKYLQDLLDDLDRLSKVLKKPEDLTSRQKRMRNSEYLSLRSTLRNLQLEEQPDGSFTHSEEALKTEAAKLATDSLHRTRHKINQKLENLDNGTVNTISEMTFSLTGQRNGKGILIEQSIRWNRSSLGMPFLQFPAIIFVDGKRTSEVKYKKMFEQEGSNVPTTV